MSKVTNIIKWWFDTHIWNLLQDLGAQDALKTLQTKLESPIAVRNEQTKKTDFTPLISFHFISDFFKKSLPVSFW